MVSCVIVGAVASAVVSSSVASYVVVSAVVSSSVVSYIVVSAPVSALASAGGVVCCGECCGETQ